MTLHPNFLHDLKKRFTGDLRLDPASKVLYSTDASAYQIEPLGVAIPKTQDDLQAAVELAAKYNIPILPRGSGSSLAGQAIGEALILDCSRHLDAIIEIDPETHSATVEPGVILSDLNRSAAKHGLTFGPDPASVERATLGGVIGNNATGAHSILYGMSADHILAADVILSDGTLARFDETLIDTRTSNPRMADIVSAVQQVRETYANSIKQNYPRSWRNSAGYRLNYLLPWSPSIPQQWDADDYGLPSTVYRPSSAVNLAPLLAGSEGTLAVIRRLTVNLVRKPKHTILCVLSYAGIAEACDDVPRLLAMNPSAVELIPQLILRNARSIPAYAKQMGWVVGDPAAVLVVEFSGDQPSALKACVEHCRNEAVRGLGSVLAVAESPEHQARIWNIRKVGLGILDSRPQSARPIAFIEDCAIPVERLGEFVREVERILAAHGTFGGMYAHASAGCLHIRPVLDLQKGAGVRAMRSIIEQVFALTMSLGGSMSSEHGDGLARGEFIERTYGREVTDAMCLLKQAADPHNLLNPKKLFDAPPMDVNLRYGESYHAETWSPALHFTHERGLAGAVEMCNGQGVCRKFTGVMCPSFQATREEAFSTRGRANLLRSFMSLRAEGEAISSSGELLRADASIRASHDSTASPRNDILDATYQALDLCLACKGCTSECPSGVDMPKLKYEFMNHYYKSHRRLLRDYLFGYFHVAAKLLSPIAPLANSLMMMDWSRTLIAKSFGIASQRPFPKFSTKKPRKAENTGKDKAVILLSDVFSHHIEPEVEDAAIEILTTLGFDVKVLPVIGAGASLLSKGFIQAAQRHAEKVLAEIHRLDGGAGLSVVGCEPPEVYCLKHEYKSLLPKRSAEIQSLTQRVWLLEEFILRVVNWKRITSIPETRTKITLHPHCHQRAEGPADDGLPSGVAATVALLTACGCDVDVIDAGCCGMAGTFGYDAEHYDLSMQVGELGVLPKVRELGKVDRGVVSTGAACRMQIQQGAGMDALHPLLVIKERLKIS